jgi:hypothetical protein
MVTPLHPYCTPRLAASRRRLATGNPAVMSSKLRRREPWRARDRPRVGRCPLRRPRRHAGTTGTTRRAAPSRTPTWACSDCASVPACHGLPVPSGALLPSGDALELLSSTPPIKRAELSPARAAAAPPPP